MYFNKFPLLYNGLAKARNVFKVRNLFRYFDTTYEKFKSSTKNNEHKYTKEDESIILKVINQSEFSTLLRYAVAKGKAKNIIRSRDVNGKFESLYDVVMAAELNEKVTEKFFDSIMNKELESLSNTQEDTSRKMLDPYYKKLRGKFLNPALDDKTKSKLKSMLGVYISASAVSWCSIAKENYSVTDWGYHEIIVENRMRQQITDIMESVWAVNIQLPEADVYIMEMPVTSLRGGGSDPNNPKILSVNLQRAQMTSMLIALLNAKNNKKSKETSQLEEENNEDDFNHYVYFLRSSLSARLFELLIGTERVSTEATINKIFLDSDTEPKKSIILPKFHVPLDLRQFYTANKPGQKELLGQSLLLAMSFMHVCVFENPSVVSKLVLS